MIPTKKKTDISSKQFALLATQITQFYTYLYICEL